MRPLAELEQRLVRWRLAGPLALWGKLPGQADYVSRRASPSDVALLQRWVAEQWQPPTRPQPRTRQRGWLALNHDADRAPDLSMTPVLFVMGAGPGRHLRGAVVPSQDRIGRPHPLVLFQPATRRWLQRRLPAACGSPDELLYWLARVLARWQAHSESIEALDRAVQALDRLQQPGFSHALLGDLPRPIAEAAGYRLVESLGAGQLMADAMELRYIAVPSKAALPAAPATVFWQSDASGVLLRVAGAWPELWGAAA
ncbi:type VI secretion system-associated protein TagF [Pelomonas sp. KK5]|uniref:type VI secretion system-associated protein TagF n=1 Tax=Pelomonas sp. KK5 TaxID=1855730 RepID=UPI00097CA3B4|nr:type VI secretion system-associated protein TagF [Pelomonas sp. KK5]